jgi:hypothetical protein
LREVRTVVLARRFDYFKLMSVVAVAIGLFFLAVGLLGVWAVYATTSGTSQVRGRIATVLPPESSDGSVHLLVHMTEGPTIARVATNSEDPADFSSGEPVTVLVKHGQTPQLDDGSGRYTGDLVAVAGGVVPLLAGIALWRALKRVGRTPHP